jgi:rubrerythrin
VDHPPAYHVWLCGACAEVTYIQDNGDHLCPACGARYDRDGRYLSTDSPDDPAPQN